MPISNRNTLDALHAEHRLLGILRALIQLPAFTGNLPLLREVRDKSGVVLAKNAVNDKQVNDNESMNLPSTKLEGAKAAFRQFMDRLLNARIRDALR